MIGRDSGMALGLIAGTTFGSGIGFFLGWHSYNLVWSVSICGVIGVLAGLWYAHRTLTSNESQ